MEVLLENLLAYGYEEEVMGGYDLYGNYYENSQDAWNAETAQMNEIDNAANRRRLDEQEREIRRLMVMDKQTEERRILWVN